MFWLPTSYGNDVYIKFWDIWYGKLILTGQADPWFTELINYPTGVSLAYHPLFYLHSFVVNILQGFMPLANAYSLTYLLIIFSSALAAYVYVQYLFQDKWIAFFGAVIFGLGPHTIALTTWPEIAWIAPIPIMMYCLHRGVRERRVAMFAFAGIVAGLTITVSPYLFVSVLLMLGFALCAFAIGEWRDRKFWLGVALLLAGVAISSAWRVAPMLESPDAFDAALLAHDNLDPSLDLLTFFVNEGNPVSKSLVMSFLQTPDETEIAFNTYVGFLPMALIALGLLSVASRRRMLPWLALGGAFMVLSLGSFLNVNGTELENILLPKYYLNQLLPSVFQAFYRPSLFMSGARLPLAILACFGVLALRGRFTFAARPGFMIVLIAVVALEYHAPVREAVFDVERYEYTQWLAEEEDEAIRLINLPMGRTASKFYLFYQSIGSYPQIQGAIRRLPQSASDYVTANHILSRWQSQAAIVCQTDTREPYLQALSQLESDGFTHVVLHQHVGRHADILAVSESFLNVEPSYADNWVSIYRLEDMRQSCT